MKIRKKSLMLLVASLTMLISSMVFFGSCGKVDDVLDEVTYKVTINNNTDQTLEIFLQVDESDLESLTTLDAGESSESEIYVADTRYYFEARTDAGDVYATQTYELAENVDQVWDIE